jgi:hypothetical protein
MKLRKYFDVIARFLSGSNYTDLRLSVPIRSSIPRPLRSMHQSLGNELHNLSYLPSITDVSTIVKQKLRCLFRGECWVLHLTSRRTLRQSDGAAAVNRKCAPGLCY